MEASPNRRTATTTVRRFKGKRRWTSVAAEGGEKVNTTADHRVPHACRVPHTRRHGVLRCVVGDAFFFLYVSAGVAVGAPEREFRTGKKAMALLFLPIRGEFDGSFDTAEFPFGSNRIQQMSCQALRRTSARSCSEWKEPSRRSVLRT